MIGSKQLVIALFCSISATAQADESRGKLLYSVYCNACHTAEIHWRAQKIVTDWSSLKTQVRRWQAVTGLAWSDEEIFDVANYLNSTHYGFPVTDQQGYLQDKNSDRILSQ